jgi:hypothetical protein
MGKAAGVITLRMNAGTAELFTDLDRAKAKVREFGTTAGTHGVSGVQAASGAIRTMEGNLNHNVRAVERFLVTTLKMGPVLQMAFPLVGGVAFGAMVFEIGQKVADFFKEMRQGPERVRSAFRDLNAPLRLTNDELAVTNDRLANDIAKLEGRRQNTLKLALDEARVAADKLAESLGKDLSSLNKLLKEENIGFWKRLFGQAGTEDLKTEFGGETGQGGFAGRIAGITDEGNEQIRKATTLKEKDAAQTAMNARLTAAYAEELQKVNKLLADAEDASRPHTRTVQGRGVEHTGETYNVTVPGKDERVRIEMLRAIQRRLNLEMTGIAQVGENSQLSERKAGLESAKANDELTKPFRERMAALNAELESANAKFGAAGTSAAGSVLMKAYGEAVKAIAEVNKALAEHHLKLTEDQEQQIKNVSVEIQRATAEAEWKNKLAATTDQIRDRIRATQMLTEAIGKGYEAQKRASIEAQVMSAVGAERFNDPGWMASHASDVAGIRDAITRDVEAAHAQQAASAVDSLQAQIGLQNRLIEAQKLGEEEIRRITALEIIRAGIARGASGQEIALEIRKYYGALELESGKRIEATKAETRYAKELASAQLDGAEAARKQTLENKYAEMRRAGNGADVSAERDKDAAARQAEITGRVAQRVNAQSDLLFGLDEERDKLLDIIGSQEATADQARALRDIERERLGILRDQQLAIGTAKAGLRAFLDEMRATSIKGGKILFDGLMSGVDGVADALSKLLTGQKANFGEMLKGVGQQMIRESLKAGIARAVTAIFPDHKEAPKPSGRPGDPVHVWQDNMAEGPSGSGGLKATPLTGPGGPPSWFGVVAAVAGAAIGLGTGGGGGGPKESVSSSISYRAAGGPVSPSQAYIVGEQGPELLTGASGRIMSNTAAKRAFGGGDSPTISIGNIDARGTDHSMVYQAVLNASRAAYREAVKTGVQVNIDRRRRVPSGA